MDLYNKTCKTADFKNPMECIESCAYQGNAELCEVAFFAHVKEIGDKAFSGCVKLEKVDLSPAGMEKIGNRAFESCSGLKNVNFPDELKFIGDGAFCGCESLEEVIFPAGINHIGESAFKNCKKLKRVVLPSRLEFVGNYAFQGCDGLEFVEIDANVTSRRGVSCCRRLCDEGGIFRNCKNLKEAVTGSNVTYLPDNCFNGCTSLESVKFGNENVSFLTSTFARVPYFKGKVRYFGTKLTNGFGLEGDYVIKDGTTEIADGAFFGCHLTGIHIPETVQKIGHHAFQRYNGRGITVPPRTTTIMKNAFPHCCDVLMPERVLPHSTQNDSAVKYRNCDYCLLMDTLARCEEIAASKESDVNQFLKALSAGRRVVFYNLREDWRLLYLTRIRGVESVLAPAQFFTVDEDRFDEFLELVMLFGLARNWRNAKTARLYLRAFAEGVLWDSRIDGAEFKTRKLRLVRRLLANDVGTVQYQRKPTSYGSEWPMLMDVLSRRDAKLHESYHEEVCAVQNAMKCLTRERSWDCMQIDGELEKAINSDRPSTFCLRWDLLGNEQDEGIVRYAMEERAKRILLEMYKRLEWLRERLPLKKLILYVCMKWPPSDAADLIDLLQREYPEECRGIKDGIGGDCLWYTLFNSELHGWRGGWRGGNELERMLKKLGYRGDTVNAFGLSYDELVEGWETVETIEAKERLPEVIRPVAQTFHKKLHARNSTVLPSQARTPCPAFFTDAKLFAGPDGVIEAWKCQGNPDIIRLWIPQEVTDIKNCTFKGCPNLEEVVCEDCGGGPPLSLGLMSFAGCENLRKVSLPVRIGSIGAGAFRDNPVFVDFAVAAGHYQIATSGHMFDNCPSLETKMSALT